MDSTGRLRAMMAAAHSRAVASATVTFVTCFIYGDLRDATVGLPPTARLSRGNGMKLPAERTGNPGMFRVRGGRQRRGSEVVGTRKWWEGCMACEV